MLLLSLSLYVGMCNTKITLDNGSVCIQQAISITFTDPMLIGAGRVSSIYVCHASKPATTNSEEPILICSALVHACARAARHAQSDDAVYIEDCIGGWIDPSLYCARGMVSVRSAGTKLR